MYSVLAIALLLSCPGGKEADNVPADTLVNIDVEEAVVVASPKETAKLRRQPVSVSIFGREALRENDVCAIKGLSAVAPNFFFAGLRVAHYFGRVYPRHRVAHQYAGRGPLRG